MMNEVNSLVKEGQHLNISMRVLLLSWFHALSKYLCVHVIGLGLPSKLFRSMRCNIGRAQIPRMMYDVIQRRLIIPTINFSLERKYERRRLDMERWTLHIILERTLGAIQLAEGRRSGLYHMHTCMIRNATRTQKLSILQSSARKQSLDEKSGWRNVWPWSVTSQPGSKILVQSAIQCKSDYTMRVGGGMYEQAQWQASRVEKFQASRHKRLHIGSSCEMKPLDNNILTLRKCLRVFLKNR